MFSKYATQLLSLFAIATVSSTALGFTVCPSSADPSPPWMANPFAANSKACPTLPPQTPAEMIQQKALRNGFSEVDISQGGHSTSPPSFGVTTVSHLSYQFVFDPSMAYTISASEQSDWNKLPGMNDCGLTDTATDAAMFGWRWNPVTSNIEISPYANVNGYHFDTDVGFRASDFFEKYPGTVNIFALPQATIQSWPSINPVVININTINQYVTLQFDIYIVMDPNANSHYQFYVQGQLPGGGGVYMDAKLPRSRAASISCGPNALKFQSGFYFGGTQPAPHHGLHKMALALSGIRIYPKCSTVLHL